MSERSELRTAAEVISYTIHNPAYQMSKSTHSWIGMHPNPTYAGETLTTIQSNSLRSLSTHE